MMHGMMQHPDDATNCCTPTLRYYNTTSKQEAWVLQIQCSKKMHPFILSFLYQLKMGIVI